ncbi:MAG: exonuclease domain-containing protein [Bacteroidota bacterium]
MELESFSALDFETATYQPESICQVGLVRVENGIIVKRISLLVQPPNNLYHYKNVQVHGIHPKKTENAPLFDEAWFEFKVYIDDQVVVAHNIGFDSNCLANALAYYNIAHPYYEKRCTRKIYGRGLAYLAGKYHLKLNHHDALSDAEACANLYLLHLRKMTLPKTGRLF